MNIIIPIAGIGNRFAQEGFRMPKPLVRVFGKPLIYWMISSLELNNIEDTIYIVYNQNFENIRYEINKLFKTLNIKFIPIGHNTRGAAETVLFAIDRIEAKYRHMSTIILDGDNIYDNSLLHNMRLASNNCIFYKEIHNSKPIYSYININQDNYVTNIIEKEKISNYACVGAYGFQNIETVEKAIQKTIRENKKQKNEFYISSIYRSLLDQGTNIMAIPANSCISLGTPRDVQIFTSNMLQNKPKYRFCFDLDNTLVTYPIIENDYSSVLPIKKNIDYLKFLHKNGHTIIIYTARRMRTHGGNVGRVHKDIAGVTIDTLLKFDIPYDELYFGKPYADFYIDDLAIDANSDLEKEIGIYNIHPEPRSYNQLLVNDCSVKKISHNIDGEKYFYENIPDSIKDLFPTLIDTADNTITIEKINGVTVSFLYTNKLLTDQIFYSILQKLAIIHHTKYKQDDINIYDNYIPKIKQRIKDIDYSSIDNFINLSNDILNFLSLYEINNCGIQCIIHGDPVFSNILIDSQDNIKFIDMRGKVGDILSICGDMKYDYAKIYQSIIGYDFILMNKKIDLTYINYFINLFHTYIINNYSKQFMKDITYITKSLIIALLPLHSQSKHIEYLKLIDNIKI